MPANIKVIKQAYQKTFAGEFRWDRNFDSSSNTVSHHHGRKVMKRWQEKFSILLASSFLLAFLSITASAQVTTADLVGTIKDNTGAVVRGVKVTLTNDATGVSRSV
ncbi:MAG: carboxypeptidase-like regulatory domain-containing protein, partial [Blastocatellia bacterium]